MSVVDDLKDQISAGMITFDKASLKDELLGTNAGDVKVTARLQELVLYVAKLKPIKISSIIRKEGHHGTGRAFDIGNEDIAPSLLPSIATDEKVALLNIDEVIFDAGGGTPAKRNRWNYDRGVKHVYGEPELGKHGNHIHLAVLA